ncbi:MAG: hypothetical protein H6867_09770 [Rhodospirillales bacterium]|nr:hypothetical protein [Rhodospirillales bacterium]MCB9995931.1 hypothetical protein [Rhodospirillales bacterium]
MIDKKEGSLATLDSVTQAWQAAAEQGKQMYLAICIEGSPSIAILDIGEGSAEQETAFLSREDGLALAKTLKEAFEHKEWEAPVDGKPAFMDYRFFTDKPKAPAA